MVFEVQKFLFFGDRYKNPIICSVNTNCYFLWIIHSDHVQFLSLKTLVSGGVMQYCSIRSATCLAVNNWYLFNVIKDTRLNRSGCGGEGVMGILQNMLLQTILPSQQEQKYKTLWVYLVSGIQALSDALPVHITPAIQK